ncbi:hypothetical protein [Streptomyces sp. TRM64462]|uniref:hypothetical protein n=1 Tax=Streptomyces sp. TRM64462 TaxID=2741726 RepID=UPI001586A835|nr:hypothetical protein [Streptomyces sp. TRM64462]
MSTRAQDPRRYAHLWEGSQAPHRWVLWNTEGRTVVFDRTLNMPADVDDGDLEAVVGRMREAGVPEGDEYPGRPCGS